MQLILHENHSKIGNKRYDALRRNKWEVMKWKTIEQKCNMKRRAVKQ